MASDVWTLVHAERAGLASDLESLDDQRWATPSLCDGWTVRDVLAHMTATAKITPLTFFPKLVAAGFSIARLQGKDIGVTKGATPADTLANFKAVITSTKHPPGPTDTWLGETIVHAEDIRRPLGISHVYNPAAITRVADFYKKSNLIIGAKKRIAGLRLRATDVDWTHGDGPEVSGSIASLVMAMTGRKAALADLAGDGVATLADRGVSEIADRYRRVADAFNERVHTVPETAWENASPCEGWAARDVIRHLVEWLPAFFGERWALDVAPAPSVDDDPAGAWAAVDDAIRSALDDPAIAGVECETPMGSKTFEDMIDTICTGDVLIHTWDIARATGGDETLDAEEVHRMASGMEDLGDTLEKSGHFGPRVAVADDADEQTRLLSFVGRRA